MSDTTTTTTETTPVVQAPLKDLRLVAISLQSDSFADFMAKCKAAGETRTETTLTQYLGSLRKRGFPVKKFKVAKNKATKEVTPKELEEIAALTGVDVQSLYNMGKENREHAEKAGAAIKEAKAAAKAAAEANSSAT